MRETRAGYNDIGGEFGIYPLGRPMQDVRRRIRWSPA
jgi:hypothetical protein